MKYALTDKDHEGNIYISEIVPHDPTDFYHPDIAAKFIRVPADTELNAKKDGNNWINPPKPEPVEVKEPEIEPAPVEDLKPQIYQGNISPVNLKMLFTTTERAAIREARKANSKSTPEKQVLKESLDDFFEILDDPRLIEIKLSNSLVLEILEKLVTDGLLTADRKDEILANKEV